ncbi:MAG: DNA-3-methyladenine glycosylase 2 family protein [Xanthomonadales bacterium]|nr:DNA-3-methyladenine glycosylase 2 family protein [Gammaproteobacteria bacterium]MBT8050740.1 DNA-3-methyladenine glycosylase 2 family protein [Gammaproteobacteria bacterium]MBT8056269.1 DNA-3-methyladenine glycosylase 2 family protein [Gammaproteobacteria bacterium]NNJ78221.1 DNA-3-methyladenine glycosylase 2 family protein [Xanthomonadales bacterium]NNL06042.1 DNA-3-methyladenine glycosylase 2 family protein [Xanthomonadales bacterium]
MSRLRYNRREAVAHLRRACPEMDRLVAACGSFTLRVSRDGDLFQALSSAIIYQQLSGKAAATIHGRFCTLFDEGRPDAAQVAGISTDALRGAGLSRNKILAVRDLAEKVKDRSLPSPRRMAALDDNEVTERLCRVRGIGPWTAQMYLIFNLGRPDVMPASDLGIQKGVQYVYQMPGLPEPNDVNDITRHLAPFRSAASWYFWLAADTGLIAR